MNDDRALSDFQRLMRSWKELAPYNAAHVLRIFGTADLPRWEAALNAVLRPICNEQLRVETADGDFDNTIVRELNRRFERGDLPLRAIAIAAGQQHFLALVYDHWFADSPSIRAFLHRAFEQYRSAHCELAPLRRVARSRSSSALRAIGNGVAAYRRHRRAARIHLRDSLDFHTGFFSRHFPAGTIGAIQTHARQSEAKVNDAFIAAAAQVLGDYTAGQRAISRRNQIAIASAIDLRDADADATFGFDVSYFSVVLEAPEQIAFRDLVRTVAQQTRAMKTREEVARFNLTLKCARFAWNLTAKPKRRAELFRKGLPLVAGISNVNLSGTWAENTSLVVDYLRVSPVGALLPLVFTLTTIGDRLSLCVSFRTTAFSESVAAQLTDGFMQKLIAFGKRPL